LRIAPEALGLVAPDDGAALLADDGSVALADDGPAAARGLAPPLAGLVEAARALAAVAAIPVSAGWTSRCSALAAAGASRWLGSVRILRPGAFLASIYGSPASVDPRRIRVARGPASRPAGAALRTLLLRLLGFPGRCAPARVGRGTGARRRALWTP
jgi:hypothetical protein